MFKCVRHNSSASRFSMQYNFPKWRLWIIPEEYLLDLWRETQKGSSSSSSRCWKFASRKPALSRLYVGLPLLSVPFCTQLQRNNTMGEDTGPWSNFKIYFKIPTYWITPRTTSSLPSDCWKTDATPESYVTNILVLWSSIRKWLPYALIFL